MLKGQCQTLQRKTSWVTSVFGWYFDFWLLFQLSKGICRYQEMRPFCCLLLDLGKLCQWKKPLCDSKIIKVIDHPLKWSTTLMSLATQYDTDSWQKRLFPSTLYWHNSAMRIVLVIWPNVHLEQLNLFAIKRFFSGSQRKRIKYKLEFTMKIPVSFCVVTASEHIFSCSHFFVRYDSTILVQYASI